MSENMGQFRSATFGGFHRQDVLDYIEAITKEHQEQLENLEKKLEQEQERAKQVQERSLLAEEKQKQLEEANLQLEQALQQSQETLAHTAERLKLAESKTEELEHTISSLQPDAESWQRIKDTAGNIEVSAHERAQMIMQCANAQAAEIQAGQIRCITQTQNCYDQLIKEFSHSLQKAEQELDSTKGIFARAQKSLDGIQTTLSHLAQQAEEDSSGNL